MLPKYSREDVEQHFDESDCWIIVRDRVYDVTSFLDEHPGGIDIIVEYAGLDATSAFEELPHPPYAVEMLEQHVVGELK